MDRSAWHSLRCIAMGLCLTSGLCAGCGQSGASLPQKTGILVMAHGGDASWNEQVQATVQPLRKNQPVAIAFGMAQTSTLRQAVRELENAGAERIAVVRMFISGSSFLPETEYILGLRNQPPGQSLGHSDPHAQHAHDHDHAHPSGHAAEQQVAENHQHAAEPQHSAGDQHASHDHHAHEHQPAADEHHAHDHQHASAGGDGGHVMEKPEPIRPKSRILLSRQGVSESPLVDEILVDRVKNLSREPSRESVLILAHGPGDNNENQDWLKQMDRRAEYVRKLGPFRQVSCETLREDWPDERVAAEKRIRAFVEAGNRDGGKVIVVPFRVAGFGPYKDVLKGLTYTADGRGFCPHPNMTRWIEEAAQQCLVDAGGRQ